MKTASLDFLKQLLSTPSPSGWESPVQALWLKYVKPYANETYTDAYGNAYAVLNPQGSPTVVVTGHADEIAFQVSYISDEGFLYIQGIGGVDPALALAQRVVIHSSKGKTLKGVVGSLAIHMQEKGKEKQTPAIHELFIDIGATSRKEAEKLVDIGDPITYDADPIMLNENTLVARGCDNRIGIFAAAETLRKLRDAKKLQAKVIAISTVQEENGLYGASMAAQKHSVDAALVVDVGHATDIPLCDPKKHGKVALGKGPVLSRGSVNHPVLVQRLRDTAQVSKLSIQMGIDPRYSGTDADEFFKAQGGIPSAVISLPNRYMHSPVEMVNLSDLDAISDLASAFAKNLKKAETFRVPIPQ